MTDFKKEALEWAQKTLEDKGIKEQLNQDFIDYFILGIPVVYRTDIDGNMTRLTHEEVWDLKSQGK